MCSMVAGDIEFSAQRSAVEALRVAGLLIMLLFRAQSKQAKIAGMK